MRSFRTALALVAGVLASLAVASCGDDSSDSKDASSDRPAATTTQQVKPQTPPERPITVKVDGKPRTVFLSRVDFAYCRKRTDVCSKLKGTTLRRLTPVGRRAVAEAKKRKAAREAAEAEQARRAAAAAEAERQRQSQPAPESQPTPQPQPEPQPQEEGTTTG